MKKIAAVLILILFHSLAFSEGTSSRQRIFDAFMKGDDAAFASEIAAYIDQHPFSPETHFYLRDLYNTARVSGCDGALRTMVALENKLSQKQDPASAQLRRRAADFIGELEFTYRKGNGRRFASEYHPVTRWNFSKPTMRFGKADMDRVWEQEIDQTAFHFSGSKQTSVLERTGTVYPERFLYPAKGIVFASALISAKGGIIVRVESNREYVLCVNGRRVIENKAGGVCRNSRSVSVSSADAALLVLKLSLSDDAYFRVTVTDGEFNPVSPAYVKTVPSSPGMVREIEEAPYDELRTAFEKSKSADAALHLGWFYSEYDDIRALEWYETSLALEENPAVRAIYASECGRFGSLYGYPSLEGREREEFARLSHRYPSCAPARNAMLRDSFRYLNRVDGTRDALALVAGGTADFDAFSAVCGYLQENGDSKALAGAAAAFAKTFPRSLRPLRYLASSCEVKNPAAALSYCRSFLEKGRDEDVAVKAANLALKAERSSGEELLSDYIDDAASPAAFTAVSGMIECGKYDAAKRILMRMAAVKDDPRILESLGRVQIGLGDSADLYWEKAASIEPASRFPRDYLTFKNGGKASPLLEPYRNTGAIPASLSDFFTGKTFGTSVIFRSAVQKINRDRSGRYFFEELIYMRGREDIERYGEYRIPFDRNLSVVECSIVRRDMSSNSTYAMHEVDGEKYLTVGGLAPDVMLHVAYEVDNYSPLLADSALVCSGTIFMNGWDEAVDAYCAKVIVPSEMPLHVSAFQGAEVTSSASGDETVWTVRAKIAAAVRHEHNAPGPERLLGWYAFSECTDSADFAEWYRGTWPEKTRIAFPRISGSSQSAVVAEVYRRLSRSLSLEEDSLFSIENPSEVLYKGKGSAEDKVFCAKRILEDYGIESQPALVMRKGMPAGTLRADQFISVILLVPVDGKELWLDFSHQYSAPGVLSDAAENANVLVIGKAGVLQRIAHSSVSSSEKYEGSLVIGGSGEASFRLGASFSGRNAFIGKYADDERYRDELTGMVAGIFHRSAVVSGVAFSSGMQGETSLTVNGTIPGFALSGSRTLSFKPFFHSTELPRFLEGETRQSALSIQEEISCVERYSVTLPEGFGNEETSFAKTVTFGRGSVRCLVTKKKGSASVDVERTVSFPECEIEPESYGDFVRFCAELRAIEQMRLTFTSAK